MTSLLWISEISNNDLSLVGDKAVKLAELYKLGLPIAQGFVLTNKVFKKFLENNFLEKQISNLLFNLDINNFKLMQAKADEIKGIIMKSELSENLRNEIFEAYDNLNVNEDVWRTGNKSALEIIRTGRSLPYMAVKVSLVNSYNNQATYLNIKGISSLTTIIKKCFASLYDFESIYYREKNNLSNKDLNFGIIIQKMINSDKSGIIINDIEIKAIYGVSELLLNNIIMPNSYIINKDEMYIKEKKLSKQDVYLTRDDFGNNVKRNLDLDKQGKQVLNDDEIIKLGSFYKRINEFYNKDLKVEFAVENSKIYIINVK